MTHEECHKTTVGDFVDEQLVELPTRVIEVGQKNQDLVRLKSSEGLRGRYCALSYCWGPPEEHPIKTTRSNLVDHLSGIPLQDLPKTFQEAVILTRELNIGYLWIDSLCIIQDDDDSRDWTHEIANMGKVFEEAFLVLAAAGSKNAGEGLFVMNRYPDVSVELESHHAGWNDAGNIHLSMVVGRPCPWMGPLWYRGWTFQERHLARRIIFFTAFGMAWMCKEQDLDERGCHTDLRSQAPLLGLNGMKSWLGFLSSYSGSTLSVTTDRLPAIEGIADVLSKKSQQTYYMGFWMANLDEQLLWFVDREWPHAFPEARPKLKLPTWSWASTGRCVSYFTRFRGYGFSSRVDKMASISLDSRDGILRVVGPVFQTHIEGTPLRCACFPPESGYFAGNDEEYLERSLWFHKTSHLRPIWSNEERSTLLGVADFDQEEPTTSCFALPLIAAHRNQEDYLYAHSTADVIIYETLELLTQNLKFAQAWAAG